MKTYGGFFGRVPMMQHALASRVHWGTAFSIGNPVLDAQDRLIFELVAQIHDLRTHGAGAAQLRAVAEKSSRVLEVHFRCEERLLAAIGYPQLAEHAAEHEEMLEDLADIRSCLSRGDGHRSPHASLRLSNFILGVTMGHIPNTDSDYCRYIAEETAKLSTGCA
jgi:hemerythrin